MRSLHLADPSARDAYLRFVSVRPPSPPERVCEDQPVTMRRFLAASEQITHQDLLASHGEALGQALTGGDPEVPIELVGQPIERTSTVYPVSSSGSPRTSSNAPMGWWPSPTTALTASEAQAIADGLITENIKKGWEEMAAQQPDELPPKPKRGSGSKSARSSVALPKGGRPKTKV